MHVVLYDYYKVSIDLSPSPNTRWRTVTKMTPRPSLVPDADPVGYEAAILAAQQQQQSAAAAAAANQQQQPRSSGANNAQKGEPGKPPSRAGACRVCLKSFKPDDYSKTCYECQQRVCEDCASYSKLEEHEDAVRTNTKQSSNHII